MPRQLPSKVVLVALLAVALVVAACGGTAAPTPPGYACVTGNYCATFVNLGDSAFTGSPAMNGAYTYIQNTNLTCTGTCSGSGYIADMMMLIDAGGQTWVESGVGNYKGLGTDYMYGVGIGGVPTYRVTEAYAAFPSSVYGFGVEIQRYNLGGSNSGYLFRYVPWYGGTEAAYVAPFISVSALNGVGLEASNAVYTHMELGQFLNGTSGATADNTVIDPPQITSSIAGSTTWPAVAAGYPDALYPNQMANAPSGITMQFDHSSETLTFPGGGGPPVATGTPPFGVWLNFLPASPYLQWSKTSTSTLANDIMVFTCCNGSFR